MKGGMSTPPDYKFMSVKKRQEFERKRIVRLQEFFNSEYDAILNQTKRKEDSFLRNYTDGEIEMFEVMLEKMIVSKNYEIFQQA